MVPWTLIRRVARSTLATAAISAAVLPASAAADSSSRLRAGSVELANSGAAEAQTDFAQGLGALHSFWYDAAREAFRRAQDKDPGFALAYWGEAMSHYRALWSGVSSASGRLALERLDRFAADRLDRTGMPEERALIEAVRKLYGAGADSGERAFAGELRRAHERLPESVEIAAFYALALQGQTSSYGRRSDEDQALIDESARVLEDLFERVPDHPGVLHYLIHAYDDPEHAELGLEAARLYAGVAPDAAHAQHMPAHIFLQLGDWQSSVDSNRRAWSVSEIWVEEQGLPAGEKDFHALGWLHYSLLQLGDFEGADEVLETLRANGGSSSSVARYGARRLIESEDWTSEVSGSEDASIFARGYGAARRGDLGAARSGLRQLEGRGDGDTEILALSLEGLIAHLEHEERRALRLLGRAAELEEATRIPSGPPDLVKSALELYGEILVELGSCDEAIAALDRSLARMPGRRLSVRAARSAAACSS